MNTGNKYTPKKSPMAKKKSKIFFLSTCTVDFFLSHHFQCLSYKTTSTYGPTGIFHFLITHLFPSVSSLFFFFLFFARRGPRYLEYKYRVRGVRVAIIAGTGPPAPRTPLKNTERFFFGTMSSYHTSQEALAASKGGRVLPTGS